MLTMPVVQLARPLRAVRVLNGYGSVTARSDPQAFAAGQGGVESAALTRELEQEKQACRDVCTALNQVVSRLNQLYDEMFAGHNEAIARLSVEIARKVLMRNISDGDYEIETIIKETLKNAPENANLLVRLNPQDLAEFRQLQESDKTDISGVDLTADESIGRAECVVESSKGVIRLFIDEHLEQISKALITTG